MVPTFLVSVARCSVESVWSEEALSVSATHVNMLDRCLPTSRQTGSPPPGLFGYVCDTVTHRSTGSSDKVTQGKRDTKPYITQSFRTSHIFEMDNCERLLKICWLSFLQYKQKLYSIFPFLTTKLCVYWHIGTQKR